MKCIYYLHVLSMVFSKKASTQLLRCETVPSKNADTSTYIRIYTYIKLHHDYKLECGEQISTTLMPPTLYDSRWVHIQNSKHRCNQWGVLCSTNTHVLVDRQLYVYVQLIVDILTLLVCSGCSGSSLVLASCTSSSYHMCAAGNTVDIYV